MKYKLLFILLCNVSFCIGQIELPVDFELSNTSYFTDFSGNTSSIITDPVNPANSIASTARTLDAETWAGTTLGETGFSTPIPFSSSSTTISLRVLSEYPGTPIHLKAEDSLDPGIFVETRMYTTKSNEWETIVFDFSNQVFGSPPLNLNTAYSKLSVFFNFGTSGAAAGPQVFYWDDVIMGGTSSSLSQIDLPVTFEDPAVSYALVDFENNRSSLGIDPLDPAEKVALTIKPNTASAWSGTVIGTRNGFVNKIPFSESDTKVRIRVYSPDINTPILLKAESVSDPTLYVETLQYTTTANEWEEMEWDFLQHLPNTPAINFNIDYSLLAIFFNFGIEGAAAGEKTYFWDDVTFPINTNIKNASYIPMSAFPNPVRDELQINIAGEVLEIRIVNTLGQTMINKQANEPKRNFDVSRLSTGVYFLMVTTKQGAIGTFQFFKE